MDTTSSLSSLPLKPWSLAIGRFSGGYCSATLQWPALVRQVTAVVSWVALGALVGHGGALHGRDSGMALTAMCSHGWMALLDLHLEGVASGGGTVHHIQSQATEMAPQKGITERGEMWRVQVNRTFPFFLIVFSPSKMEENNTCLLPHLVSHDIGVFFLWGIWSLRNKNPPGTCENSCCPLPPMIWLRHGTLGTGMHPNGAI